MIVYRAFMSASGFWTDKEMKATFTAFFGRSCCTASGVSPTREP